MPGYETAGQLYLFPPGRRKDGHASFRLTLPRTRFPSLRVSCFLGGSRAPSARGGPGPAKRSTLTLTFQHARLHKAADIHTAAPQTHSHATGLARCTGSTGLRGLQEGRRLSHWQGVTNNCSSTDMLNGPTANLPDGCVVLRQGGCFSRRSQRVEIWRNQNKQTKFNVIWPLHKLSQIDLLLPFTFVF